MSSGSGPTLAPARPQVVIAYTLPTRVGMSQLVDGTGELPSCLEVGYFEGDDKWSGCAVLQAKLLFTQKSCPHLPMCV